MVQSLSQELQDLYRDYGIACVQLEIAQNRHNETKKALVDALNKPIAVEPKE